MTRISLHDALAELHPGYFALVMATGIVANACYQQNIPWIPWILLVICLVAYAGLWIAYAARLLLYRWRMWADLKDHLRGPGFFSIVAATCVCRD